MNKSAKKRNRPKGRLFLYHVRTVMGALNSGRLLTLLEDALRK